MQSWRTSTPQPVQDTFDGLCGVAMDAAVDLLTKNREFFPFGLEAAGEDVQMAGADPGSGEHPPSQAVLDVLYEGCRSRRESLDAVAFVSDVRLQSGGDAIRIDLEHRTGHALEIVVPYRLTKIRRGVDTGAMAVAQGTSRIW